MKTTVLKASKELADAISADLLSRLSPNGKHIFKRIEIENGFQIIGRKKNAAGEIVIDTVFRYISVPAPRFEYNEQLIKI